MSLPLSPRQHQILKLLAEGKRRDAIAHELGISLGTLKVHTTNMMRNVGADTVAQAVAIGVRAGLIE